MAVIVPYVENPAWADGSGGGTPITAAKLNVVEDGITNAHLMPAARVTHNASQSITTSVETVLAFNTERFDTAGGVAAAQHDTVTNNSRLTCLYAGKYQITANVAWAVGATGIRDLRIKLNGTTLIAFTRSTGISGSDAVFQSVTTLYDLAVNDFVQVFVFHTQGTTITIDNVANYSPEFMMARVA
jgi:hypothetical protein